MRTNAFVVLLIAAACAAPARADADARAKKTWHWYGAYEYFLPANSDEGLKEQLDTQSTALVNVNGYDSASHSSSKTGGSGTRVGVLRHLDSRTQLGGSVSYALGPTLNSNVNAFSAPVSLGGLGNGGQTVNRSALYWKLLLNARIALADAGRWGLALDSGWGLGVGHVEQSCSASGSLNCGILSTKKTWTGFAWEFGPLLTYRLDKVDLNLAVRYAGFPPFSGNEAVAPIRWESFGMSFGATF